MLRFILAYPPENANYFTKYIFYYKLLFGLIL